jgi:hypothetical protein
MSIDFERIHTAAKCVQFLKFFCKNMDTLLIINPASRQGNSKNSQLFEATAPKGEGWY